MSMKYLGAAALALAFVAGTFPAVVLPSTPAAAATQECGWLFQNGKMTYLGACAESGDATEQPPSEPDCRFKDDNAIGDASILLNGCG